MTTKQTIIQSARELFQLSSYQETTIQDILTKANVSRSTFYHHFHGKEDLLFSIASQYDAEYANWKDHNTLSVSHSEQLLSFYAFAMNLVEYSEDRELLAVLYGLQVMTNHERQILSPNRNFYKIPLDIISRGQHEGAFSSLHSPQELTQLFSTTLIGLTYSWCLSHNAFSLSRQSHIVLTALIKTISLPQ